MSVTTILVCDGWCSHWISSHGNILPVPEKLTLFLETRSQDRVASPWRHHQNTCVGDD